MSNYTAIVIKTGNSIALRVPKQYATDAGLVPGDRVNLKLAQKYRQQDRKKIQIIISKLQGIHAYSQISNPVTWQRAIRKDRAIVREL